MIRWLVNDSVICYECMGCWKNCLIRNFYNFLTRNSGFFLLCDKWNRWWTIGQNSRTIRSFVKNFDSWRTMVMNDSLIRICCLVNVSVICELISRSWMIEDSWKIQSFLNDSIVRDWASCSKVISRSWAIQLFVDDLVVRERRICDLVIRERFSHF